MEFADLSLELTIADALALGLLLVLWRVLVWLIEHPPVHRPSVTLMMADIRRDWMRTFVTRQPRIFDATVIESLRQATAFFASATMIALGAGVALLGDAERLAGLAADFNLATDRKALEVKLIVILVLIFNGFLKFVWANRLFGYCAIMMGSVPNDPQEPGAFERAAQAAEINITAARSYNRGLESIYFAIATLAWLVHPAALAVATVITGMVIARREFASNSRVVIMAARRASHSYSEPGP